MKGRQPKLVLLLLLFIFIGILKDYIKHVRTPKK